MSSIVSTDYDSDSDVTVTPAIIDTGYQDFKSFFTTTTQQINTLTQQNNALLKMCIKMNKQIKLLTNNNKRKRCNIIDDDDDDEDNDGDDTDY